MTAGRPRASISTSRVRKSRPSSSIRMKTIPTRSPRPWMSSWPGSAARPKGRIHDRLPQAGVRPFDQIPNDVECRQELDFRGSFHLPDRRGCRPGGRLDGSGQSRPRHGHKNAGCRSKRGGMMDPEEVAKLSNGLVAEMCEKMHSMRGSGPDYHRCAAAASTTLLFHIMSLGLHKSKENAVEILTAVLSDVADNLKELRGIQLRVEVHAK